jgi:hypothetical protein
VSTTIDLSHTSLSRDQQLAVAEFCAGTQAACGAAVLSISLHGSALRPDFLPGRSDINLLVVTEHLEFPLLQKLLPTVTKARGVGLDPLFLTKADLRAAVEVFPGKFMALQSERKLLIGVDLLGALTIDQRHLRLRCRQECENLLLRMRRRYLLQAGHGLTRIMAEWSGPFLDILRMGVVLAGNSWLPRDQVIEPAAHQFNFDPEVLCRVRDAGRAETPLSRQDAEELFERFLGVVTVVARALDA